jgi:diguanylate cyclase (GGDEF)-like protein/PAS domain S-box-containing protein
MNTPDLNILFVEDSEDDVMLEVRELKRDGLNARWQRVDNERDLRAKLGEAPPNLILSDYSMPGFNGIHALAIVREVAPHIPFIFVSGTIGEERAIEAIRSGATDYVLKHDIRRLSTAVRRAIVEAEERGRARAADEERARLVDILEKTSDYVGMSDVEGKLIYLNIAGRKLVGLAADAPLGVLTDVHPEWAHSMAETDGRPAAIRDGHWQGESAMIGPDGSEIPVSQVIVAHRGASGEIKYFSTIARDIRDRKAYEARIEYLANYDDLTGLPNRSLLRDRTEQAIAHARRAGRPCALLVINLDRFKLVNDSYGIAAGDALLKMVSERLSTVAREGDTVARLSADTFVLLAVDLARPGNALAVATKVQEIMSEPFIVGDKSVHAPLSIGASTFPVDGEEFDLLLRNADAAMHRVKAAGSGGFQFYAATMTSEASDRVELENDLRVALEQGQLELHYQPQVELPDRVIRGVEALMRWRHPTRGMVSPGLFIPIAEDMGIISAMGAWVVGETCRRAKHWDSQGCPPLRVAVNVSAHQFRSPGFVESVEAALRATNLDPSRIEVELTESILVRDQMEAIEILTRLNGLGVKISVDDFGTGYSSLSYLSRMPIDCLKIDQSFVSRLGSNERDKQIVQAVISLSHALGMRVIAEGVETAEQLDYLLAMNCDEAQGYYFSRPVPPDELGKKLLGDIPALAAQKQ